MYYIEAKKGNKKWISGIFLKEQDAANYFQLIAEDIRNSQIVKSAFFEEYPVYLVEAEEFYFTDLQGVNEAISQIEIVPDFKYIYINIYEIQADFTPKKAGQDCMGILKHLHIDNEYLERYKKFCFEYNLFDLPWDES